MTVVGLATPFRRIGGVARPIIILIGCLALVLGLETLPVWHAFGGALLAIDFDQERTAMLQSLGAGMLLAASGTLLSGRPWTFSVAGAAFVSMAYVAPLGPRLSHDIPILLGVREVLNPGALWRNQLVIVALAFLSALVAAGIGQLLRAVTQRAVAQRASDHGSTRHPPPLWTARRAVAGLVLLASAGTSGALALTGADPLLRFGPSYAIYRLPAVAAQSMAPYQPAVPAEIVPTTGQVVANTYHSVAMGADRRYLLYLPPSYGMRAAATHRYPVVFLLHGDPSAPEEWINNGTPGLMDGGIARQTLAEAILVIPDGNGRVTASTWWADRFDGRDPVESALVELVGVVDRTYRTIPDPAHRVIAGLSSGGFGAANIAGRHPNLFGTAMSFAGTYVANGPVFGNASNARANSPYYVVQDQPAARAVRFILVVGMGDAWRKAETERFAAQLNRFGVPHDLHYLLGGHGPEVWVEGLALGLLEIAPSLTPQAPPPDRIVSHGYSPRVN